MSNRLIHFALSLCLFAALLATTVVAQQAATQFDNLSPDRQPLACTCSDVARLKDRLQKLTAVELLIAKTLQSTAAATPASLRDWNALQGQIAGYLQAMQIQGLTTFNDSSLFSGNADPFCGTQKVSAGACLDQDFAVHQSGHDASCRAGNWNWQISWTDKAMLQEEAAAIQKEMDWIRETIKKLGCGGQPTTTGTSGPGVENPRSCPQFVVMVQNVTTSNMNVPGLNEGSARSLNNGQGVPILLTFHPDGTFDGAGSGTDSGAARGSTPGEVVNSQFGHAQSMAASGSIRPGSCASQPCQPDVMHLVLVGGPSQQMTQGQARGQVNRDLSQTTATGGARLEFDLPAYIGGSAQKTFMSTPMLNSYMTVNLVQGNNGAPGLPNGRSIRYELQQCKSGPRAPTAGGSGGAGIVIPGLEGTNPASNTGGKPGPQ